MIKKYLTRKFCVIVIAVCCAVVAMISFFVPARKIATPKNISSADYWVSQIQRIGGAGAYSELATDVSSLDPSAQHGAAHVFGGALFSAEGLSGISICDSQFSYGCYHEFIGQALLADGLSVLSTIRSACDKTVGSIGCRHGIGHGLIAYFGYGANDLQKAITTCSQIADTSEQGCFGGTFMEYNMRTMTGLNNARPLDDALFAPCNMFSGAAAQSCMYYQPQWWWSVLPESTWPDKTALLNHMNALCRQSSEEGACTEGVGLMVPASVSYDPQQAIAMCKRVTTTTHDDTYCASGAALVLAGTSHTAQAQAVCAGLSDVGSAFCTQYAFNDSNVTLPL